jgi:hypothetical protein
MVAFARACSFLALYFNTLVLLVCIQLIGRAIVPGGIQYAYSFVVGVEIMGNLTRMLSRGLPQAHLTTSTTSLISISMTSVRLNPMMAGQRGMMMVIL